MCTLILKTQRCRLLAKNATTPDTAILHPLLAANVKNVTVDKSSLLDTHDQPMIQLL